MSGLNGCHNVGAKGCHNVGAKGCHNVGAQALLPRRSFCRSANTTMLRLTLTTFEIYFASTNVHPEIIHHTNKPCVLLRPGFF